MKISIGGLFKKGEFWTSLENTISKIVKKLKQNSAHIKDLENKNNLLIEHLKHLKQENKSLSDRLLVVEERAWNIHLFSKSEGITLGSDALETESIGSSSDKPSQ